MPESLGGEWATKDKGLTKKSWSLGIPYFLGRAGRTLGLWTEPPIFAWIIITTGDSIGIAMKKLNQIGQGYGFIIRLI